MLKIKYQRRVDLILDKNFHITFFKVSKITLFFLWSCGLGFDDMDVVRSDVSGKIISGSGCGAMSIMVGSPDAGASLFIDFEKA